MTELAIHQVKSRFFGKPLKLFLNLPFQIFAILAVCFFRLIRPWVLVRLGALVNTRIGHFAGNTEMYLCEQEAGINVPKQPFIDFWYFGGENSNKQLAKMWKRKLRIWPRWFFSRIYMANRLIPGSEVHCIGNNTQGDRDVNNLWTVALYIWNLHLKKRSAGKEDFEEWEFRRVHPLSA